MDLAQMLLSGWMLSTEALEDLCRTARGAGALGAKLTGSGGGGCVIALADDGGGDEDAGRAGAERIAEAWRKTGHTAFATRIARRGRGAQ
jgi:mevalonate kinase